MEKLHRNNTPSKSPMISPTNENVAPISTQNFIGRSRYHHSPLNPIFDASISSGSSNSSDSSRFRFTRSPSPASVSTADPFRYPAGASNYHGAIGQQYLGSNTSSSGGSSGFTMRGSCSLSPLPAVEMPPRSPPLFKTPLMKVQEDVVVMDGILLESLPGGRVRSSSSSSSDRGGTPSASGSNSSFHKQDKCWFWEDSGSCRFGSKCQFVHGELRPNRYANKNKSEGPICKGYNSGSCAYGAKCRFLHHRRTTPSLRPEPTVPAAASASSNPQQATIGGKNSTEISSINSYWSPLDDSIEITLPPTSASADNCKTPSREEVDSYLQGVLYGESQRKRLPVFAEICPE